MWDLPRPGFEPLSLALAGGFLNHCSTREVPHILLIIGLSRYMPRSGIAGSHGNFTHDCIDFLQVGKCIKTKQSCCMSLQGPCRRTSGQVMVPQGCRQNTDPHGTSVNAMCIIAHIHQLCRSSIPHISDITSLSDLLRLA